MYEVDLVSSLSRQCSGSTVMCSSVTIPKPLHTHNLHSVAAANFRSEDAG